MERKIISKNTNSFIKNIDGFIDNEKLKSLCLEKFINEIIEETICENFNKNSNIVAFFGLGMDDRLNEDISINLLDLLKTTNTQNWYEAIKCFMNIWEFLFLYSTTENTLKQILKIEGDIKIKKLLEKLHSTYKDLDKMLADNGYLTKKGNSNLFTLYTELRNVYSHSHGMITKRAKGNLNSKIDNFKKSLDEMDIINKLFVDAVDIFRKDRLQVNKFYLLQDQELNVFRNFITTLFEALDDIERTSKNV